MTDPTLTASLLRSDGAEELDLPAAECGARSWSRVECTDVSRDYPTPLVLGDAGAPPVDLRRVRGEGLVLLALACLPQLHQRERLDQRQCAQLR